jgi:hypothetical protein
VSITTPSGVAAGERPPERAGLKRLRKIANIILGILIAAVLVLTVAQPIIFSLAPNPLAYGSVQVDANGNPQEDKRGAFIMLFPTDENRFPSDLLELLATSRPGVVDEASGVHLYPDEIAGFLVQTASVGEPDDYRIYKVGADTAEPLKFARQPGGKRIILQRQSGEWQPGSYIIDVPAEGMFGGRTFFHFYIDARPTGGDN